MKRVGYEGIEPIWRCMNPAHVVPVGVDKPEQVDPQPHDPTQVKEGGIRSDRAWEKYAKAAGFVWDMPNSSERRAFFAGLRCAGSGALLEGGTNE